jgi:hypothetical protein
MQLKKAVGVLEEKVKGTSTVIGTATQTQGPVNK